MASAAQNRRTFYNQLNQKLDNRGLGRVDQAAMNRDLLNEGLCRRGQFVSVLGQNHVKHNRSLGPEKRASAFSVDTILEEDKGRVLAHYMNPDSSENAPNMERSFKGGKKGPVKPGQNYAILKVYDGKGDPNAEAERVFNDICHYEGLKHKSTYYAGLHIHSSRMPEGFTGKMLLADDGMSAVLDILLMAAAFNRDFLSLTSHNYIDPKQFLFMQIVLKHLGVVGIPGTEATIPSQDPNGPHVCIWGVDVSSILKALKIILKGRSKFRMPPLNDGTNLLTAVPQLYRELASKGKIAMGIAHPMNIYRLGKKDRHPIYDTGLVSCIQNGPYTLPQIQSLLPFFQATAMWNETLDSKIDLPKFDDRHFNEWAHEIVSVHLPGIRATPNSFALAFAKEMQFYGRIKNSFHEEDDHNTPPFHIGKANGVMQARGHTEINASSIYSSLARDRRPSAAEFVSWFYDDDVRIQGHAYLKEDKRNRRLLSARTERDPWISRLINKMAKEGDEFYTEVMKADVKMLLGMGQEGWRQIKNLERTYDYLNWWEP